jgi:CRISPR/Cas system-associated endoribonuclease Cas2
MVWLRWAVQYKLTDEEDDTVRIYRLCGDCEPRMEIFGRGRRSTEEKVYVV